MKKIKTPAGAPLAVPDELLPILPLLRKYSQHVRQLAEIDHKIGPDLEKLLKRLERKDEANRLLWIGGFLNRLGVTSGRFFFEGYYRLTHPEHRYKRRYQSSIGQ